MITPGCEPATRLSLRILLAGRAAPASVRSPDHAGDAPCPSLLGTGEGMHFGNRTWLTTAVRTRRDYPGWPRSRRLFPTRMTVPAVPRFWGPGRPCISPSDPAHNGGENQPRLGLHRPSLSAARIRRLPVTQESRLRPVIVTLYCDKLASTDSKKLGLEAQKSRIDHLRSAQFCLDKSIYALL
jgi:hypothetical protein